MVEDRRKQAPNRRLDSWKEIAAFFGRDERTVKRWEKERGLPVLRLPGARGGVYSFTDDLSRWMETRKPIGSIAAEGRPDQRQTAVESGASAGRTDMGSVAVLEQEEAAEAPSRARAQTPAAKFVKLGSSHSRSLYCWSRQRPSQFRCTRRVGLLLAPQGALLRLRYRRPTTSPVRRHSTYI